MTIAVKAPDASTDQQGSRAHTSDRGLTCGNLKIRQRDWVVVCDGTKALVLENAGDDEFPNLKTKEVYAQNDPKTHEQGTDAPGRVHQSVGTSAAP